MAAHWQYLRIHYPRCVARRGCLSKLLTLQTCIHLAAVTVAIAIKKKKKREKTSHLALVSIVCFAKIKFLCSVSRGGGECQQWSLPAPGCSGRVWGGLELREAPQVSPVHPCAGRTRPLSHPTINHFHGRAKGLGSVLHPLPQGPAHALPYLPRNALDLCCYFLEVKSAVPVGIHSRVRAAQSRGFATSGS